MVTAIGAAVENPRRRGGARRWVLPTAVWLALGCSSAAPERADDSTVTIIDNVNLVTMVDQAVLDGHYIAVRDGIIVGVGPSAEAPSLPGATVVDGGDRWVSPGLVDAHVHLALRTDLERFLAHGVTSVREMWGLPFHLRWRDAIAAGDLAGPNLVVASTFFWLDGPAETYHVEPTDPETARALVGQVRDEGYDLIKVVNIENRAALEAVVDEATKVGLTVSGHYPDPSAPADEMLTIGMTSFEHADEFAEFFFAADSSPERLQTVARRMADSGVGLTTILSPSATLLAIDQQGEDSFGEDALQEILRTMGPYYYRSLSRTVDNVLAAGGQYVERWSVWGDLARRAAPILVREGVTLAIGTEGIRPLYTSGGVGIHDELAVLEDAGLSNHELLTVATVNGARLLGFGDRKGQLAVGFDADLLLLKANPLESPSTLRDPVGVMVGGRYFDARALQILKELY